MKAAEVTKALGLQVRAGEAGLEREVTGGCVSDLLSYVMGNAHAANVWITIQVHPNIIGVAELLDLSAIIIAGGQEPEAATLEKAQERAVTILSAKESAFMVAGRLYELGVR